MRKTSKAAKRACARKRRYQTESEALNAAFSLWRQDGARMRAYRCHVGAHGERRHWHIGRSRSRLV